MTAALTFLGLWILVSVIAGLLIGRGVNALRRVEETSHPETPAAEGENNPITLERAADPLRQPQAPTDTPIRRAHHVSND